MRRLTRGSSGFTVIEIIVTVAIISIVGAIVLSSAGNPARLIQNYQVRVAADAEARSSMNTILRLLRSAVPGSVNPASITNDDPENGGFSGTPNSHIKFLYRTPDQTAYSTYEIYMTSLQPPTIRMKITPPTGAAVFQTLASNVSFLTFNDNVLNPTGVVDQTVLDVSLDISVLMNGTGQTHDVQLLNQEVRVGGAP